MVKPRPKVLGQLLLEVGDISEAALEEALSRQLGSGQRIGALLVESGSADEESVAKCLSLQLNLPYQPPPLQAQGSALKIVHPELARRGRVLPLTTSHRSIRLAMADPLDLGILDDVQFQSGRRVEAVVASPGAVLNGIIEGYGGEIESLLKALPEKWRAPNEENVSSLR